MLRYRITRCRPFRAAVLSGATLLCLTGSGLAFGFPGSSLPGSSMGIPGFSDPFSGMPGGFPGFGNRFPGFGNSWPDVSGNLPYFSRIFPDFRFNRKNFGPGPGPWGQPYRNRRQIARLPGWLAERVRPGAGAVIFDMAFVQDRSFRRARLIMLQTSTYNGILSQRCFQNSLSPMMSCQAQVNGNVSQTYMMPAPRTSPTNDSGFQPYNGMQFSSKGRWRGMSVYGRFQYWPGRFSF